MISTRSQTPVWSSLSSTLDCANSTQKQPAKSWFDKFRIGVLVLTAMIAASATAEGYFGPDCQEQVLEGSVVQVCPSTTRVQDGWFFATFLFCFLGFGLSSLYFVIQDAEARSLHSAIKSQLINQISITHAAITAPGFSESLSILEAHNLRNLVCELQRAQNFPVDHLILQEINTYLEDKYLTV